MNIRHAEFMAMVDAFLGPGFDEVKIAQVESLQIALHQSQAKLYGKLKARRIKPSEYLDAVKQLHLQIAMQCEAILGPKHFKSLFGISAAEAGHHADSEAFIAQS